MSDEDDDSSRMPVFLDIGLRLMRTWPRRRHFRLLRASLIVIAGAVLCLQGGQQHDSGAAAGLALFIHLTWSSALGIGVAGIFLGFMAIHKERREQTLGVLLMTAVDERDMVLGMIANAWMTTQLLMVGLAPLLLLVMSFGGVGIWQHLGLIILLQGILLCSVNAGVLLGMSFGKRRAGNHHKHMLIVRFVGFIILFTGCCSCGLPFYLIEIVSTSIHHAWVQVATGVVFGLVGWVLLSWAVNAFHDLVWDQMEPVPPDPPPKLEVLQEKSIWNRSVDSTEMERASKEIAGHPLVWKDVVIHSKRKLWPFAVILATPVVTMLLFAAMALVFGSGRYSGEYVQMALGILMGIGGLCGYICPLLAMWRIHSLFGKEHESKLFDGLILAGLTPTEIIISKIKGGLLPMWGFLLLELGGCFMLAESGSAGAALIMVCSLLFGVALGLHAGISSAGPLMLALYTLMLPLGVVVSLVLTQFLGDAASFSLLVATAGLVALSAVTVRRRGLISQQDM